MTKFNPHTHITGKVYDLTQENFNAVIEEVRRLRSLLDVEIKACALALASEKRLRVVMKWYANEENFTSKIIQGTFSYSNGREELATFTVTEVLSDKGKRARHALDGGNEADK